METKEKLGQDHAFPVDGENQSDSLKYGLSSMSKRFFAANNSIAIADNMLKAFSIKSIVEFIGVEPSEYNHYLHYPVALSKMSYVIADEMLRQENV